MVVKVYHRGSRIDVYDTAELADASQCPGNVLANYAVDADEDGGCLWLDVYYHVLEGDCPEGPHGLPVAARRDGWSVLLADAGDLSEVERVAIDGETVMERAAGRLVGTLSLSRAVGRMCSLYPDTAAAARYYAAASSAPDALSAGEALGIPPEVLEDIERMERRASDPAGSESAPAVDDRPRF